MSKKQTTKKIPSDKFSALINLFNAMDITEKGIEIVYDYLLKHQLIDDPKSLDNDIALSLKRIYKIVSVLKDLDLVQVYGRPMKVVLKSPKESWERIVSDKIEIINFEAKERIDTCKNAFDEMINNYKLADSAPSSPPVEFISLIGGEGLFDLISSEIISTKKILVAKGLLFNIDHNNLYSFINQIISTKNGKVILSDNAKIFINNFIDMDIKLLVSKEYLDEKIIRISNFDYKDLDHAALEDLSKMIKMPNFDLRVVDEYFSNFALRDEKDLLQYSVSPTNSLIGLFISREKEVVEIFSQKFNELFTKGTNLFEYFEKEYKRKPSIIELFVFMFL